MEVVADATPEVAPEAAELSELPTSVLDLIVSRFKGADLVCRRYAPRLPYLYNSDE